MSWRWMPLDGIKWQLGAMKEEEVMGNVAGWQWERKSGCICGALLDTTTIVVRVLLLNTTTMVVFVLLLRRCCCCCYWYTIGSGVLVAW